MTDADSFYSTGCGNCACSRAAVIHAGGCPRALRGQLRNEPTRPVPVEAPIEWRKAPELPKPDFIERWAPIAFLVLGGGWSAFLLAVLAHRLGWV